MSNNNFVGKVFSVHAEVLHFRQSKLNEIIDNGDSRESIGYINNYEQREPAKQLGDMLVVAGVGITALSSVAEVATEGVNASLNAGLCYGIGATILGVATRAIGRE